jgi:GNAT superfamily N-acetyltransferase
MAMTKSVIIKPITGNEASHLLRQSDEYMALLYPDESNHLVDSSALLGKGVRFIGVFIDDVCAGCVGVPFFQGSLSYGKIKPPYVDLALRGKDIASKLLAEIEQAIIAEGTAIVQLETGVLQKTTICLYGSLGYYHIKSFGSYIDDLLSLFMEKHRATVAGLTVDASLKI